MDYGSCTSENFALRRTFVRGVDVGGGWQRLAESHSFGAAFGELVRTRRGQKGLDQVALGRDVYGGRASDKDLKTRVSRLENGRVSSPQARTVQAYAHALGITDEEISALRAGRPLPDHGQTDANLAMLSKIGAFVDAQAAGIPEATLIDLARRVREDVADADAALRELDRAVEIAVRVQREGAVGSNHADFVDAVLARVAELSRGGAYKQAGDEIDAALAREAEESAARAARLLDSGVEMAVLARDAPRAAALLVRRADHDAGGRATFDGLRVLRDAWYVRGRDKGLTLDLRVAIHLARQTLARAGTPDRRGAAGNDLGIALRTLGARESGTARLEEAVTAYRAALEEWTRDRVPLDWAMTQMNLGNALATLGERESGTARLEEAVAAYRAALEERTRDRVPLDWARTQMNLGNALRTLGERESGTARLEEAVAAYRAALEEMTRDRVPLDWAATTCSLAYAQAQIAERTGDLALALSALPMANEAHRVLDEGGHEVWARYAGNVVSRIRDIVAEVGG
ncbi:XRE family transcriptional regulator [Rhodobacteraceae bacterium CCMM004]|nr:XRE family transcriptional regulator [Rhodobacteraceae bacterium CCMM004]